MKIPGRLAASLLIASIAQIANVSMGAPRPDKTIVFSPAVNVALANGLEAGKKAEWKGYDDYLAATRFVQVTLGNREFVFSRQGRFTKVRAAHHPSAGVVGNLAEAGWDYLDKDMKIFSDTYGHLLLSHTEGGRWKVISSDTGSGYASRSRLHNTGVPASFMKKLKLGEPNDSDPPAH